MEAIKEESNPQHSLLHELETAINDEILAAFQYWTGYQLSAGPGKYDIDPILQEHTQQEWEHVELLSQRVRELGGSFCTDMSMIQRNANVWYPVTSGDVRYLADLIYDAESRAVNKYTGLAELSRDSDPVTYDLIVKILRTETEHRYELGVLRNTL